MREQRENRTKSSQFRAFGGARVFGVRFALKAGLLTHNGVGSMKSRQYGHHGVSEREDKLEDAIVTLIGGSSLLTRLEYALSMNIETTLVALRKGTDRATQLL